MRIAFLSWLLMLIYTLIFIVQLRIKIGKKKSGFVSHADIVNSAKEGDMDAVKILKRGKIMIGILVVGITLDFVVSRFH